MAAATYDHMQDYPDSPIDSDEQAYPCKGCGKILEEGKAFELAGNRWHIDCFRCNTCETLLDSDANLLLLGDGSLICNNCTYSCSNCGNKIEDLAILTGDQAFCANCFKCRSCKRKIENLRYARTSQGIFCMDCHEALMARRRKKTARGQNHRSKNANIDKSLPAIPPPEARHTAYLTPGADSMYNDSYIPTTPELPTTTRKPSDMRSDQESDGSRPPTSTTHHTPAGLTLPSTTYRDNDRQSYESQKSEMSGAGMAIGAEEFLIPLAFDPNPPKHSATTGSSINTPKMTEERPKDYFNRSGSHGQQSSISQTSSPHIAYQDKSSKSVHEARQDGRTGSTPASPLIQHEPVQSPHISQLARNDTEQTERFKLQDPPKNSRVPSQTSTPRADITPVSTHIGKSFVAELEAEPVTITPRKTPEPSPGVDETTDPFKTAQNNVSKVRDLPKRGDSLEGSKRQQTIPRKEITPTATVPPTFPDTTNNAGASPRGTGPSIDLEKANGGKVISAPIVSSESQNLFEASSKRQQLGDTKSESFVEPRVPPAPPENAHTRNESISTAQSEAHVKASPKLPHYSAGGDFTMDEDMARILASGEEAPSHGSFLRKVSNSVRHARSHSDKSGRISRDRWPKSPVTASSAAAGQDISSPSTSSPEHREELAWFKNELQRERQRNLVREKKISELEAQINSAADISQVNVELREKRSTMVVLDTQKEIVVRELEVLTEHIAKAKKSGEPLDMGKMNSAALRDLAESLQKLKDSFAPQIESLTQKRNDLLEEISHLTQSKDKSFQEFEQLSNKNAQLAEFNNQLVDQIQNIYKNNRAPTAEEGKPNGLGIYSHHKEKSSISIDARDIRPLIQTQYPLDPNATYEAGEAGAAQSLGGVHMVEMKKGAVAKRFDWRKGQKMAKGLTKNVKGAFTSAQQNYGREMQFAETGAYGIGGTQGGQEYSALPRNNQEPLKQGWFSGQRPQGKNGMYQGNGNDSTPSLLADAGAQLFGSDLTQRVEYEKASIPGIVKRCIQEVEARGMDVEGIYRKSGGNSQVQQVKDGFERQPADYDISDQDLDIHAVTSGLKQYFRKLPSPLITYDCYDRLIELTKIPEGPDRRAMRIQGLKDALDTLPKVHYDTLDYLMRHLSRVVVLEKENLMTPMNVAVVFAPTIMRPESVARELSDTKAKNEVVMWMVQECDKVFDN